MNKKSTMHPYMQMYITHIHELFTDDIKEFLDVYNKRYKNTDDEEKVIKSWNKGRLDVSRVLSEDT